MYFKGYAYTSFACDGFEQGARGSAIRDLRAQTGSTWIALTFFEFQRHAHSVEIAPHTTHTNPETGKPWYGTSSRDDLRIAVRDARSEHVRIMLKPHVDCYSGEWRARITPDRAGAWFTAYAQMMMKYARLASEEHIEMLCIGTELISATQERFSAQWRSLIADIRSVYSGMLTYSSNWTGLFDAVPEYEQISFWNELDLIGVSAYLPIAGSVTHALPADAEAESRLHAHGARLSALAVRTGRRVVLTECGCRSVAGALIDPADSSDASHGSTRADESAQACYYTAVLKYFGSRPWCAGIFWWNWEAVPGAREAIDYTCRGKFAARVLKEFYTTGNEPRPGPIV
ncbi:MAG TPA: hypothetical protein VK470_15690 [Bacteroidota bacterium]|nr:hypothetical protein [Bacteroidota bacterium]